MKVAQFAVLAMLVFLPGCTNLFGTRGATQDPGRLAAEAYAVGDFSTAITLWTPNDPTVTCASVIPRDCVGMFGEDPDPALSALWYRLAAEQGLAEAQNNLGTLYGAGVGVPQDNTLAYAWFSVSADQGNDAVIPNRDLVASRLSPAGFQRRSGSSSPVLGFVRAAA